MPEVFYSLNEHDLDYVLNEMGVNQLGIQLSREKKDKLIDYLKSNFHIPWDEYIEVHVDLWLHKEGLK